MPFCIQLTLHFKCCGWNYLDLTQLSNHKGAKYSSRRIVAMFTELHNALLLTGVKSGIRGFEQWNECMVLKKKLKETKEQMKYDQKVPEVLQWVFGTQSILFLTEVMSRECWRVKFISARLELSPKPIKGAKPKKLTQDLLRLWGFVCKSLRTWGQPREMHKTKNFRAIIRKAAYGWVTPSVFASSFVQMHSTYPLFFSYLSCKILDFASLWILKTHVVCRIKDMCFVFQSKAIG